MNRSGGRSFRRHALRRGGFCSVHQFTRRRSGRIVFEFFAFAGGERARVEAQSTLAVAGHAGGQGVFNFHVGEFARARVLDGDGDGNRIADQFVSRFALGQLDVGFHDMNVLASNRVVGGITAGGDSAFFGAGTFDDDRFAFFRSERADGPGGVAAGGASRFRFGIGGGEVATYAINDGDVFERRISQVANFVGVFIGLAREHFRRSGFFKHERTAGSRAAGKICRAGTRFRSHCRGGGGRGRRRRSGVFALLLLLRASSKERGTASCRDELF